MRGLRRSALGAGFNESDHPRGKPGNAGQFTEKSTAAADPSIALGLRDQATKVGDRWEMFGPGEHPGLGDTCEARLTTESGYVTAVYKRIDERGNQFVDVYVNYDGKSACITLGAPIRLNTPIAGARHETPHTWGTMLQDPSDPVFGAAIDQRIAKWERRGGFEGIRYRSAQAHRAEEDERLERAMQDWQATRERTPQMLEDASESLLARFPELEGRLGPGAVVSSPEREYGDGPVHQQEDVFEFPVEGEGFSLIARCRSPWEPQGGRRGLDTGWWFSCRGRTVRSMADIGEALERSR